MTTSDRELEEYLSGQSRVARVYRQARTEGPTAQVDRAIIDAARASVRPRYAWSPFASHWFVPASLAAVLVLVVGVYMFSAEHGGHPEIVPRPMTPAGDVAMPAGRGERMAAEQKEVEVARARPAEEPAAAMAPAPAAPTMGDARVDERAASREASAEQPKSGAPSAPMRDRLKAEVAKRKAPAALGAAGSSTVADVVSVKVSGAPGAYYFDVAVRSTETGCRKYADWWEVVSEDGKLLYRRVLLHSHVDEQPFARSGGPVAIQPNATVWVRAHMNPGGYGGVAFRGSPQAGFRAETLSADFAAGLGGVAPLPDGCAF